MNEVFDRSAALNYVGHDIEFLRELLAMLHEHRPKSMKRISAAIESNDCRGLHEAAHRLKGMLGSFHSIEAAESARELEHQGKVGSLHSAADLFLRLDSQLDKLCEAIGNLASELE